MQRPDLQAPGLIWREMKDGWEARWQARTDLVRRGFLPKSTRLWSGAVPTEMERAFIAERCDQLQSEMLVWGRGGIPEAVGFTGSIPSLIRAYGTDPDSPYRKLRYKTRIYYDALCEAIEDYWKEKAVHEITARDMLRWHEHYTSQGKIAMGHAVVGMLRTLATFGSTLLESRECRELKALLHDMRFTMPKSRNERLTAPQAEAIRAEARRRGLLSIALAQAFQFECMFRQKDVIGEWVPINEPGLSAVHSGNWKWLRGIDWKEINENWILTHVTSKRQKEITVDLRLAPMVVEELGHLRRDEFPRVGPVIVREKTGLPWPAQTFRNDWRACANAAGVPKSVRNMDSRAGAISEATDAGADLEHVRQAATHSDIGMTQKYSRNSEEKTAGVMLKRQEHRKNKSAENK